MLNDCQWVQLPPGNWVAPTSSYRSGGGAAVERIVPPSVAPSRPVNLGLGDLVQIATCLYAVAGDARHRPYYLGCFWPEVELGPRGFDLVIGDLPRRVFPVWY